MVKPEKFGHLQLVYHFTVPLAQLSKALEFPQLISMELPNTVTLQMQKVN